MYGHLSDQWSAGFNSSSTDGADKDDLGDTNDEDADDDDETLMMMMMMMMMLMMRTWIDLIETLRDDVILSLE